MLIGAWWMFGFHCPALISMLPHLTPAYRIPSLRSINAGIIPTGKLLRRLELSGYS